MRVSALFRLSRTRRAISCAMNRHCRSEEKTQVESIGGHRELRNGKRQVLVRVLGEFRGMRHEVDIVVNTNIPKDLGPDVEVVVGYPAADPRSLPFAHKQIFADRSRNYDLFIYTEDDTLITEENIDAFLRVTAVLPENEIAGFLRTEQRSDGAIFFPDVIFHYHWDVESICRRGPYKFAYFSDEHSGSYILTKEQLRRAISSGGFIVPFYDEKYPPLETAATDPYTRCGFRKMMCISHFQEFILPTYQTSMPEMESPSPGRNFTGSWKRFWL